MPAPNLHPVLLKGSVQSKQNQTQPPGLTFNISFPTSPYIAQNLHHQCHKAVIEKALSCSLKAELRRVAFPWNTDTDGQEYLLFLRNLPFCHSDFHSSFSSAFPCCFECSTSTFSYMKAKLNHTLILHYNLSS